MMTSRIYTKMLAGAVVALGFSGSAMADKVVKTTIANPATMHYDPHFYCDNTGSKIQLTGELAINRTLPVAIVELWNSPPGSQTAVMQNQFKLELQDENGNLLVDMGPKQPSAGGAGGNPHFYFQLDGNDATPQYLGRCISPNPASGINRALGQGSLLSLVLQGASCSSSNASITATAGRNENPISGKVYLTNNDKGTLTSADIKANLGIIFNPGGSTSKPKSVAAGGAGGNPIVKVQFLQCMKYDVGTGNGDTSGADGILQPAEEAVCMSNRNTQFDPNNVAGSGPKLTELMDQGRCNKL